MATMADFQVAPRVSYSVFSLAQVLSLHIKSEHDWGCPVLGLLLMRLRSRL